MQDEEDDIIIHPRRSSREKRLPEIALLIVNPAESVIAHDLFTAYGALEQPLYNSKLLVDRAGACSLAGPCLGAPAASLVMEKLIALGASRFLLFSCCGALDPALAVGDIVLASAGVCGEGVSRYYGRAGVVEPAGAATEHLGSWLEASGRTWRKGTLFSTDAPYRESRTELARLRADFGIDAVDMEFSALCSIAHFRQVELGGVFIVSDELWGAGWRPGFSRSVFLQCRNELLRDLLAYQLGGIRDSHEDVSSD